MIKKFVIKPLKGGPDAFAKLRPYAEDALGVKGAAPVLDVTGFRRAVVWLDGPIGPTIRIWHVPDGSQLSGEFLLDEDSSGKRVYVVNTAGVDQIKVTSPSSIPIAVAPISYEDYIKRAVPDPIGGAFGLDVDFTQSALLEGEGGIEVIMPRSSSMEGQSGFDAIVGSLVEMGGVGNLAVRFTRSATLSAVGNLTASGNRLRASSTTLSTVGDVVVSAHRIRGGSTTLDAEGGISAVAGNHATMGGTAGLSANFTLTLLLAAVGGLSASATRVRKTSALLDAIGGISASAYRIRGGSASFAGVGGISAISSSQTSLSGVAGLSADALDYYARWEAEFLNYVNVANKSDVFMVADEAGLVTTNLDKTLTGNFDGDPQRVSPLQDDDAGSVDFDGSGDVFDIGDHRNPGSSSNLTIFGFYKSSTTSLQDYIGKYDPGNQIGYFLEVTSSGVLSGVVADGTNNFSATGTTTITDGNTHTIGMTIDRRTDTLRVYVDGVEEDLVDISTLGSLTNAASLRLGEVKGNGLDGIAGEVCVSTENWADEAAFKMLEASVSDRTSAARNADFKKSLPNYVGSSTQFWWAADYNYRHNDGEGMAQLTDFTNRTFAAVQRNPQPQPTARGNNTRGTQLGSIEMLDQEEYMVQVATTIDLNLDYVGYVVVNPSSGSTVRHILHYTADTQDMRVFFDSGEVNFELTSDGGSTITTTIPITTGTKQVIVYRWGIGNESIELGVNDGSFSGATNSFSSSQSYTNMKTQYFFANTSGGENLEGNVYEGPAEIINDPKDIQGLAQDVADRHGI